MKPQLLENGSTYALGELINGEICNIQAEFVRCSSMVGILDKPGLAKHFYGKYGNEECAKILEKASLFGTRIHELIDSRLKGKDLIMTQDEREIVESYFNSTQGWELVVTEQLAINRKLNYVGRFDQMYKINGEYVLCDTKTGSMVGPEAFLQVTAYTMAKACNKFAEIDEKLTSYLSQVNKLCIIHLMRDKKTKKAIPHWELISRTITEEDRQAVRCLSHLYYWGKNRGAKKNV